MTYKVYSERPYLKLLKKNVDANDLGDFGEIVEEIFDDYQDKDTKKHAGYVLKQGIKRFYALKEIA